MKQIRIPPILVDIVQSSIQVFDNAVFENRDVCPACGGSLSGYDTRKRQFAIIYREGKSSPVNVYIKRFSCHQCGAICSAGEPYYPDTRHGSPVVDLCRTLSTTMPFHRTSAYLGQMGIVIDRGTVRNYARGSFPEIPTTDLFGIRLPLSIVSLSSILVDPGERSGVMGAEMLAACGFPSAYRAAPDRSRSPPERDEREKKKNEEERHAEGP
jgi:hypothetical protein